MFDYGKIYSKIGSEDLTSLNFGFKLDSKKAAIARMYFSFFGYPDVASQMRYSLITRLLKLRKGQRVLDAGCGNGIYVHQLTDSYQVIGIGVDGRRDRIKLATRINKLLRFNNYFKISLLENFNLKFKKFDKIICLEVLEHINEDRKVVKKLGKHLKIGGTMIITIPMKGTALSLKDEHDPNFEPEEFEHVRSGYDKEEIMNICKSSNFKKVTVREYFFLFSKYAVKLQQFLYKRKLVTLNLLLSPVLSLVAYLDNYIKIYPRGYIVILTK